MKTAEEKNEREILGIKFSELKITLVSIAYFFCVISSYYVIKPIRGSLALELGAKNIPLLNILSMLSLFAGNAIYSLVVGRYKRDIFIPFITRFFVVCLLAFWLVFAFVFPINPSAPQKDLSVKTVITGISDAIATETPVISSEESSEKDNAGLSEESENETFNGVSAVGEVENIEPVVLKEAVPIPEKVSRPSPGLGKSIFIGFYYLWVNLFALFAVSMFWSFMNDVFSVGQSRRLYAIIGYGGLFGGLFGGLLTSALVKEIGTSNLFILASLLLYPSIWCMKFIHSNHYQPAGVPDDNGKPNKPAHPPRPWDGFSQVIATPVLIFMALEMFTYTFSSTMFFQQFNHMVETTFANDLNGRTEFVAGIYNRINSISLFTQFFVTRLLMSFANPVYGLLLLNFIQVAGSIAMLFVPSLSIVSWTLIIRYALNYSTGRALRELIYIPLSREQKYQGKGFIDTVVFRLGDGISSLMLIGGLSFFSYGSWIDVAVLVSLGVQVLVIMKIAHFYSISQKKQDK